MHDYLEDFTWHENRAFADLICETWTQDEIERVENEAEWGFEQVDRGLPVGEFE